MELLHIRLKGFATNSSSSHSVIITGSMVTCNKGPTDDEFGWEFFLQSTKNEKMRYMAQALYDCLSEWGQAPKNGRATKIVKELLGVKCNTGGAIDHQSSMEIPKKVNGKMALDFWKEFSISLSTDHTVEIAGGNDNGGDIEAELHPFWATVRDRLTHYNCNFRVRKEGKVWTLFNTVDGEKLHLSLEKRDYEKNFKPTRPELIDLKITNKCKTGCNFCYQGSNPSGKHAKYDELVPILRGMSNSEVFEIAIGGGEPTLHPQFRKIVEQIRKFGMVPNFSTKNYEYFTKNTNFKWMKGIIGSIGISVDTLDDVRKYMEILEFASANDMGNDWASSKIIMHYILDNHPISHFIKILKILTADPKKHGHILLLGKKNGGRSDGKFFDNTGWSLFLDKFSKESAFPIDISIDTLIVNRYPHELKDISPKQYYSEEGRFSVYIDAVDKKFGKASYGTKLIPYTSSRDILGAFRKWKPEKIL